MTIKLEKIKYTLPLYYKAPWDAALKIISSLMIVLFLVLGYLTANIFAWLIFFVITFGSALFIIKGYSITDSQLIIHRVVFNKTYNLNSIVNVEYNPEALKNSLRIFGIGGAFSYTGVFFNKYLGRYTAYAANRKNCVVLFFENKKVAITPDKPEEFVEAIKLKLL